MTEKVIKLGVCQMAVTPDKAANLSKARGMIKEAAAAGCQLVILPEMFNCPYQAQLFSEYAESYPEGETIKMLSQTAAEAKVVVVGGSMPERDSQGNIYNTSFIFNENGELLGRHRKMHMFDVDIQGGTVFKESGILSAGHEITVVKTADVTIGVAICYDIRFPELSRLMTLAGAQILIFPSVFSLTTGPAHWKLLMQSRAIDNQVFVVGAAPGNTPGIEYQVYGHSAVIDPWGQIIEMAGADENMLIAEINLHKMSTVREQLPLLQHRRSDVYEILSKKQNI
ncbi:MAG: carbon-nitrogen hydrolase family protein [Sporomusaceae bacterium]|nr:carbon-nitrogen hydrolase family protein [Sporomusaceae bacterium]